MTFDNWQDSVEALKAHVIPATQQQHDLASQIGLTIHPSTPALVAADILRSRLSDELQLPPDTSPTYGQEEFLDDLVRDLGMKARPDIETKGEASSWIVVLDARRAIKALTELKLRRGDLVRRSYGDDDEVEEVGSIAADGTVYFVGGRGQRVRPNRLLLLERGTADTASTLRNQAAERRRHREGFTGPPSAARLATLAKHHVKNRASGGEALLLEAQLEDASDEAPIQKFLESTPEVLASLVRSTYGTFVVSLPRLGGKYIPDFAIAAADSAGIHWTVVELESPQAQVATMEGREAGKLRTALAQIRDWRDWLENNLDMARRPVEKDGLGLTDIRPDVPGLVLIGRTEIYHYKFNNLRHRLVREQRIDVHTYSWLVDILRGEQHPFFGPLEHHDQWW